jgi:hypothetical protein
MRFGRSWLRMTRIEIQNAQHHSRRSWSQKLRQATFLTFAVSLMSCLSAVAQQPDEQRKNVEQRPSDYRPEQVPDFARENLNRVAASPSQVREVLVKDAGLMVELKRWVAKEASDNGQIVEDTSLTDDAIFDRLEHDLAFRSIATRLAQRYGYLLPNINPDSAI